MILAPSDIHFLQDATSGLEDTMADLCSKFLQGHERIPKVQVAEKNGFWFALNNSYLHIIRDLEKQGKCAKIRVEVVPLTKVPKTLQKGMVVGSDTSSMDSTKDHGCYRITGHSNCRIPPSSLNTNSHLENLEETDDTSSYSSSEYSDYEVDDDDYEDVSDSEYDDDLTCNVCDRSFGSTRLLSQHQQRRRHFGCSICNSCFPSLPALERHKESLDHWSEDDGNTYESEDTSRGESDRDDPCAKKPATRTQPADKRPEEMERLL
ncbi:uncharacterized protein LOC129227058 [Uloborus diversus]|uniref:uncharacterized protein LOC129227058 n=1 Tax=Uloborus diversus TaxID=327109 RepID=UPI002409E1BB|nr:uncharacterized protein LOC129227058 [Uloborus diversus]